MLLSSEEVMLEYFDTYFYKKNLIDKSVHNIEKIECYEWGWILTLQENWAFSQLIRQDKDNIIYVNNDGTIFDKESIAYNDDYCFNSDYPEGDEEGHVIGEIYTGEDYFREKFLFLCYEYDSTLWYLQSNSNYLYKTYIERLKQKGDEESGT